MNVTLNPELEKFVQYKMKSGLYESPSEVVNEGIRLLWEREQERIEEMLLDSEKSEESPLVKSDWKELRRRVRDRAGPRQCSRRRERRSLSGNDAHKVCPLRKKAQRR